MPNPEEIRELRGGRSAAEVLEEASQVLAAAAREAATPNPLPPGEHILSCPACWVWQLHYTDAVRDELIWTHGLLPLDAHEEFDDYLETLLREHVARECTQPLLFFTLAKNRGVI